MADLVTGRQRPLEVVDLLGAKQGHRDVRGKQARQELSVGGERLGDRRRRGSTRRRCLAGEQLQAQHAADPRSRAMAAQHDHG